jgi:hypothetical protein
LFISFSNPKLWFAAGSNRKARDFSRAFAFLSDLAGLERIVTAFGGSGFLGRRVVRHLRSHGFSVRIASRLPIEAGGADLVRFSETICIGRSLPLWQPSCW